MGVRFNYRKELYVDETNWMKDDIYSELFIFCPKGKTYICLAEIKRSIPRINQTWTNESKNTLIQLLMSLGVISKKQIPKVVRRLQTKGFCNIYKNYITLLAIGNSTERSNVGLKIYQ